MTFTLLIWKTSKASVSNYYCPITTFTHIQNNARPNMRKENISSKNQMKTVSLRKNQQLWHGFNSKPKHLGANSVSPESSYQEQETHSVRNESFLNEEKNIFQACYIFNIYSPIHEIGNLSAAEKLKTKFRTPNIIEAHCIETFLPFLQELFLLFVDMLVL